MYIFTGENLIQRSSKNIKIPEYGVLLHLGIVGTFLPRVMLSIVGSVICASGGVGRPCACVFPCKDVLLRGPVDRHCLCLLLARPDVYEFGWS